MIAAAGLIVIGGRPKGHGEVVKAEAA
jgi:hypothetical protein